MRADDVAVRRRVTVPITGPRSRARGGAPVDRVAGRARGGRGATSAGYGHLGSWTLEFAPQKQKALSGGPSEWLQKTNIGLERILSRGTKALKPTKSSRPGARLASTTRITIWQSARAAPTNEHCLRAEASSSGRQRPDLLATRCLWILKAPPACRAASRPAACCRRATRTGLERSRFALRNMSLRLSWKICGWPGRIRRRALICSTGFELAEDGARAAADSASNDCSANDDIAFQPRTNRRYVTGSAGAC